MCKVYDHEVKQLKKQLKNLVSEVICSIILCQRTQKGKIEP